MRQLPLLVILAALGCMLAQQSSETDIMQGMSTPQVGGEVPTTLEETKKLPLKTVRKLLADRGLKCEGCTEKGAFFCSFVHMCAHAVCCLVSGDLVDMLWCVVFWILGSLGGVYFRLPFRFHCHRNNRDAPVKQKDELFGRPVKHGAATNGDQDYEAIMRQIQEEQNKNNKFKKLLEEKGINTAGMNFGGCGCLGCGSCFREVTHADCCAICSNSGDPAKLAELLEKLQHAKPPSAGPNGEANPLDADARREDIRQQHAERLKQRRAEARRRKAAANDEDVTEL
jgi:hypothetical protein